MPTSKQQQPSQDDVNNAILEGLQAIRSDVSSLSERVAAVESAPAPAATSGGSSRKAENKPNTFGPTQVARQGWNDPSVGDEVTYTRGGRNPGQSLWKIVQVDADGTVHANKLGEVEG